MCKAKDGKLPRQGHFLMFDNYQSKIEHLLLIIDKLSIIRILKWKAFLIVYGYLGFSIVQFNSAVEISSRCDN